MCAYFHIHVYVLCIWGFYKGHNIAYDLFHSYMQTDATDAFYKRKRCTVTIAQVRYK